MKILNFLLLMPFFTSIFAFRSPGVYSYDDYQTAKDISVKCCMFLSPVTYTKSQGVSKLSFTWASSDVCLEDGFAGIANVIAKRPWEGWRITSPKNVTYFLQIEDKPYETAVDSFDLILVDPRKDHHACSATLKKSPSYAWAFITLLVVLCLICCILYRKQISRHKMYMKQTISEE